MSDRQSTISGLRLRRARMGNLREDADLLINDLLGRLEVAMAELDEVIGEATYTCPACGHEGSICVDEGEVDEEEDPSELPF